MAFNLPFFRQSKKMPPGPNVPSLLNKTPSGIHHVAGSNRSNGLFGKKTQPTTQEEQTRQDDIHYAYAQRRLMMEKKKQEAAAATKQVKRDPNAVAVSGTGSAFTDSGSSGFKKGLDRFLRANRSSYKNLSREDETRLHDIIKNKLHDKTTGSEITQRDKYQMKQKARKEYQQGHITKEDLFDMKKIIDHLD